MKNLYYKILKLDKKGYGAYKTLKGEYKSGNASLTLFHVQGDPYASPSKVVYSLNTEECSISTKYWGTKEARIATADFLHRKLAKILEEKELLAPREKPEGKAWLKTPTPGQEILERSAVRLIDGAVEFRLWASLPGDGRKIEAQSCAQLLCEEVPSACAEAVFLDESEEKLLQIHTKCYQQQLEMRQLLEEKELVAFVGNGAMLPRESGTSALPLKAGIPFQSPKELAVELQTSQGVIKGMGIPRGVTLVVGGAFHGKTTLVEAILSGIYNHIPKDGREVVVCNPSALGIHSESGRIVNGVNISWMFHKLHGKDTENFVTENASGSTSQAASLTEAMNIGCELVVMDEDECSVNFLYKDQLMKTLIPEDRDPLTPLVDHIETLKEQGLSLILVAGASGEYFKVADQVVVAHQYEYSDQTKKAKALVSDAEQKVSENEWPDDEGYLPAEELREWEGAIAKRPRIRCNQMGRLQWCGRDVSALGIESLLNREQAQTLLLALQKSLRSITSSNDMSYMEWAHLVRGKALNWIDDGGSPDLAEFHWPDLFRLFFRTPRQ